MGKPLLHLSDPSHRRFPASLDGRSVATRSPLNSTLRQPGAPFSTSSLPDTEKTYIAHTEVIQKLSAPILRTGLRGLCPAVALLMKLPCFSRIDTCARFPAPMFEV